MPIDSERTLLLARYHHRYLPRSLGGRMLTWRIGLADLGVVTLMQDVPMLRRQLDPPGDFSNYRLYEADRAIGLFFGMIRARESGAKSHGGAPPMPPSRTRAFRRCDRPSQARGV